VPWESIGFRRELVRQIGPQLLDQLAHRLRDGFDAFEDSQKIGASSEAG
jgi:uncharacterized protein (DUF934 family)